MGSYFLFLKFPIIIIGAHYSNIFFVRYIIDKVFFVLLSFITETGIFHYCDNFHAKLVFIHFNNVFYFLGY